MNTLAFPAYLDAAQVDAKLPTPLYHQIYLLLRNAILRSEIRPDEVLPGELDLALIFNVSRITVKRALNELAKDKLVTRHRGRGTIVNPSTKLSVIRGSFETLIESLRQMGDETRIELLDVAEVVPGGALAEMLDLRPKEKVQKAVRLRSIEGSPFSYLISYVPLKIARNYTKRDLATKPLLTLLERAGVKIDEAEQWITSVPAEPIIADALGVAISSPLLKIERVMRDSDGASVELLDGYYRPDRFVYHIQQHGLFKKWKR